MPEVELRRLAHARSGDKGDTANVGVIAYTPEGYAFLKEHLTADRVAAHFEGMISGSVERFEPHPKVDFTYHTNHPLVNRDWHPAYLGRCEARGVEPADGLSPCFRFATLEERFGPGVPITPETIVAALASRDHERGPICGDWTYGCTLFELRKEPVLLLAPGRPDRYAFQRFGFD